MQACVRHGNAAGGAEGGRVGWSWDGMSCIEVCEEWRMIHQQPRVPKRHVRRSRGMTRYWCSTRRSSTTCREPALEIRIHKGDGGIPRGDGVDGGERDRGGGGGLSGRAGGIGTVTSGLSSSSFISVASKSSANTTFAPTSSDEVWLWWLRSACRRECRYGERERERAREGGRCGEGETEREISPGSRAQDVMGCVMDQEKSDAHARGVRKGRAGGGGGGGLRTMVLHFKSEKSVYP